MSAALGQELQRALGDAYLLERELGRGGMGAVWLARDERLHRQVAIKVLPPELATQPDLRERFLRETRMAASFSHPHIVPVHAVEERDGMLAFVMGFVDGESLAARVRRAGPLPVPEVVRLMQEVAWALSYAHGRGVIHRDIKPDNILVERATQRALVTDFGIARSTTAAPADGLTRVGEVVGTPHYMSPEQAAGDVVDGRSDLYSLGIVGFFALTGRLPFEAPTPTALLAMHLTQAPPSVEAFRPDAPPELVEAIARCLAKEPEARWSSGEALASALDGLRRSAPEVAPQVRVFLQRFGTAGFTALALTLIFLFLWRAGGSLADVDRFLVLAVVAAAIWGVAVQAAGRARMLVRQGFRFRDVQAAAQAVLAEEVTAQEAIRAMPDEMARRRRRLRIGLFSLLWAPIAQMVVLAFMREADPTRPGVYFVSLPGILMAVSAAVAFGLGVTMLASDPLAMNPMLRLQGVFWRGPVGRVVFRAATWGMPELRDQTVSGAHTSPTVRASASSPSRAMAGLSKDARRQLGDAPARLTALEREVVTLTEREATLAVTIAEAADGARGGDDDPTLVAAREAVRSELALELERVRGRHREIASALEHARLELLRLRTGLGNADAVRRALEV
jgi:eukaryotic-like serine/threonine-protein kinase